MHSQITPLAPIAPGVAPSLAIVFASDAKPLSDGQKHVYRGEKRSLGIRADGVNMQSADHQHPTAVAAPGHLVRQTRQAQRLTLAQLGKLAGYSASQVSRYERGISPMSDVAVLRRFAQALGIAPEALGLAAVANVRHGHPIGVIEPYPRLSTHRVSRSWREDGEDPVQRRTFLANLVVTATATTGAHLPDRASAATPNQALLGTELVARLRDAMLGLGTRQPDLEPDLEAGQLSAELARALADFHTCQYASIATRLPRLIRTGQSLTTHDQDRNHVAVLAQSYILATRMLIKLDESQIGWLAADRARQLADVTGDPFTLSEAARNLAVLARKAGWNEQAMTIALDAADDPRLNGAGRAGAAQRGLLIQSAAYTAARNADQAGMRQLTSEAAAIAATLGKATMLRDHGGGFSPATVQLHLISAENSTGDPSAALAAARAMTPQSLPSVERRSRYYTDIATAYAQWGRREQCVQALLHAEHNAPQETHTRPAVKALIAGLLTAGRTTPELRGLAARSGVLTTH